MTREEKARRKEKAKPLTPTQAKNLKPVRTSEEAAERGRQGGLAAGRKRHLEATMRETLKSMLSCRVDLRSPVGQELKARMNALGFDGDPTVLVKVITDLLFEGDYKVRTATFIRDTIGEKPVDQIEDLSADKPAIIVQPFSPEQIAKAKAEKAERDAKANGHN